VTLSTAEAKADILPVNVQLYWRILYHYIDLHTLPKINSIWDCWKLVFLQRKQRFFPFFFKIMREVFVEVPVQNMKIIELFCLLSWQRLPTTVVQLHEDREHAIELAKREKTDQTKLFTDSSCWNGLVGMGL
jgi:hypothetical protein